MKQFKLIAFDVDGTITQGISWNRINNLCGISIQEDSKWHDDYFVRKIITYDQWIKLLEKRYRESAKTRTELETVALKTSFIEGAQDIINKLKQIYQVCLISSGLDIFVSSVSKQLGISKYYANYTLAYRPDGTIESLNYISTEENAKVQALQKICEEKNIKPEEIVFVGDSSNDLDAFVFTRHGILVGTGNEKLKKAAWKQVGKLKEIETILL